MSKSILNDHEQHLISLMLPFEPPDAHYEELLNESQALLAQVGNLLASGDSTAIKPRTWHDYLNTTRRPGFLKSLASPEARSLWADHMFQIVDQSQYTLLCLLQQRVTEHPGRLLFRETNDGPAL